MNGQRSSSGEGQPASGALVAGVGRFGSRALRELLRLFPRWRPLAVDRNRDAVAPWTSRGVEILVGEAVEVLDELLEKRPPLLVIPAVPFHLAAEWIIYRLSASFSVIRIPVPDGLNVPNPLYASHGDLYTSYATFTCPEDCPEPADHCTVTGKKRTQPLFQLLGQLSVPGFSVLGLRSRQLAPGVGGYLSSDLMDLLQTAARTKDDLIIYTACRCHGVLSALRLTSRIHNQSTKEMRPL